ncbi:MAG: CsgG/HfaB family protein [Longimicrobiales bacterium]
MFPPLALLMLALLLPVSAAAQDAEGPRVPTIAVLDFNAFSLTGEDADAVGRGLATMITTVLADRPQVHVVDRQQIQQLIESRQLALSGRMDESRALELGRLLGAQYIVIGNVALEPERARIDLRVLDVASGTVEKASRQQGGRDRMLDLVTALADDFLDGLELPTRVAAGDADPPVEAVLAYSRGLAYEEHGQDARAAEMYRRALELFPRHGAAAAALERVEGGG